MSPNLKATMLRVRCLERVDRDILVVCSPDQRYMSSGSFIGSGAMAALACDLSLASSFLVMHFSTLRFQCLACAADTGSLVGRGHAGALHLRHETT